MLYAFAVILAAAVVLPLWRPLLLAAVVAASLSRAQIAWLAGSVAGGPCRRRSSRWDSWW